jgi:hypothetical protein
MEVKSGADAHNYRTRQAAAMLKHPLFLFWSADADPYHIGLRPFDGGDNVFILFSG